MIPSHEQLCGHELREVHTDEDWTGHTWKVTWCGECGALRVDYADEEHQPRDQGVILQMPANMIKARAFDALCERAEAPETNIEEFTAALGSVLANSTWGAEIFVTPADAALACAADFKANAVVADLKEKVVRLSLAIFEYHHGKVSGQAPYAEATQMEDWLEERAAALQALQRIQAQRMQAMQEN